MVGVDVAPAGAFTTANLIAVWIEHGTSWNLSLWAGVIIATTMICWMIGRLLRAGLPGAPVAAPADLAVMPLGLTVEMRWTRDPQSIVRPQLIRAALDDLGTPEALGRSPLGQLPGVSRGGSAGGGRGAGARLIP